jgi:hypothetical protein
MFKRLILLRIDRLILFSFFCLYLSEVKASHQIIDSLKNQLIHCHDSTKAKILSDLCFEYRNISLDSAIRYGNEAIALSRKRKYNQQLGQSLNDLGIIYTDKAEFEKALALYFESLGN